MINLLKIFFLSLILLLYFFTNFAFAKNLKEEKKYEILINAKSMQYDEKKQLLTLENPRFTYKDIIITAPYAEYDYKKNIGNLTGGIKITQPETILTAKEMKIFYKEKKGIILGNVYLVTTKGLKDKKENIKEKQTPVILSCEEMEFFWEKQEILASKNVKIKQKNKRIFCNQAHYKQKKDFIHLIGNVNIEQEKDNWISADEAYMYLTEETVTAEGNVHGKLLIKEESGKESKEESE